MLNHQVSVLYLTEQLADTAALPTERPAGTAVRLIAKIAGTAAQLS